MELDHIGIAVKSIERTRAFYETGLGLPSAPHAEEVAGERVRVLKLQASEGVTIELIEPTSEDSAVAKFIERKGEGLHHLCYRVEDIAAAQAKLESEGYRPIWEKPRPGADGCTVNFYHPKDVFGVLTELSQPPN